MKRLALTVSLLAIGACASNGGTDPDGVPGCQGKCDGLSTLVPLAGPESLIRCALVDDGDVNPLQCAYTGVPTDFPVTVTAEVSVLTSQWTDAGGRIQAGQVGSYDFTVAESANVLEDVPEEQFPVIVLVTVNSAGDNLVGRAGTSRRSDLREVQQTFTLSRTGDVTPSLPLPYDLWPLTFFADEGTYRSGVIGPQEIRLEPWELFLGEVVVNHEVDVDTITAETTRIWLPVERGATTNQVNGTFCAAGGGCSDLGFTLAGPGVYKIASDGVTRFGANDVPGDAGPGIDGAIDGGTGDVGPADAGTDTGPTCGTNGQRPCDDGTCAPGHEQEGDFCFECGVDGEPRCSTGECAPGHRYNGRVCQVCGGDGQTYCGTSSDRTCNDGHRYNGSVCQVCGSDGQTYCGTSSDRTCNDGHRYNGSTCQVCGSDGQTYCGSSSDRQCNDGHRYNGRVCQVCGGEGQTYCGSSTNRQCNEGLRWNGSACVPE